MQGSPVLDAQYDHSGRRLAIASTDGVQILVGEELTAELRYHKQPVVALSWGRGPFAGMLASGSEDGQVVVWREVRPDEWQVAKQMNITGSVSSLAFCPAEFGLALAVAGADELGVVTMLTWREARPGAAQGTNGQWQVTSFAAHNGGVAGLSWTSSASPATLATGPAAERANQRAPRRFVTGGADGAIIVWSGDHADGWEREQELWDEEHTGSIRDVAWCPNVGIPSSLLATCTDDGCVATWVQDMIGDRWHLQSCWHVDGDARRLSWSITGMLLSVAVGDNDTVLFKRGPSGRWLEVCTLDD